MSENSSHSARQLEPGPPVPRRPRWLRRLMVAVAALVVVGLGASAAYVYSIDRSLTQNITRSDSLPAATPTVGGTARPAAATGALNYVLLGSDTRDPNREEGRSDSIMVAHLDADRAKSYIISFPRDMYVDIPGHGKDKINAAYSLGGAKLTVATLEGLLGVRMDHVALVDFEGFIQLTESLGGVTVKNSHAFSSHGFDYPEGNITISGEEALWFVRERHSLPGGDLDRAENQRKVIKAIVQKGLSRSALADPAGYLAFVSGVAQHVTVDSTLSDAEIRSTALSLRLTGDDVEILQAPISGFGTSPTGESIDLVDQARLKQLATALRHDTVADYLEKNPKG